VLERGGNAFDAAVATAFVLHVVEPHMNGIGGDVVILARRHADERPTVVCGQGVAPATATIDAYRSAGHDVIPANGLLAAVVPGAFDAWMALLRDYGTLEAADVLAPAIGYARHGAPVYAGLSDAIGDAHERLATWPSSAEVFLPSGVPPSPGELLCRPSLADTLERLLDAGRVAINREARIDAVRASFRSGFVAEAIDEFSRANGGFLTGQDVAEWSATYEAPATADYAGWSVYKADTWTQGPMLLQALRLLECTDVASLDPDDAAHVHLVVEALKLAFADREAWYGDPALVDVPLDALLSRAYARDRAELIEPIASTAFRPGSPEGRVARLPAFGEGSSVEEPIAREVATSSPREGDTCHFDVIDRWGNVVAATPSGGWLQGSPVIPALGFALGTRGQILWLQPDLASSLRPGCRPRTTLTPSLAVGPSGEVLAFGSPGGDSQEQWSLQFFLRFLQHGGLQAAIEAPYFQCSHGPGSFFPRRAQINRLLLESRFPPTTVADLRARGHGVQECGPWVLGRNCAALLERDGRRLRAAASPRRAQGYAVGR
jgi:gamma-glutamyltranspeptidase/glutathione hydrolase